jgi:trehalose 6-phosphate synthase/phosphatase
VITGREKKVLDNIYNIPHLGLAAEFGAFIKWNQSDWESRISVNELWKDTAKHIIQSYVIRTEGSYLEEKENSIVFQYKNCDIEYGSWQAKELVSQLDMLLSLYVDECEIVEGTGYVEVKPRLINKGFTVEYLLDQCFKAGIIFDFVLVIGDDSSDEEMFKVLKDMIVNKHQAIREYARCFSVTLGRKPTEADFYLNDSSEIIQYLEALRHWTKRDSEVFANWNSSMHIVDIVRRTRGREGDENI